MNLRLSHVLILTFLFVLAASCGSDDDDVGLRAASPSDGPQINFDPEVRPFPDIPYPNDLMTRPDGDSPTGLRVNLPGPEEGFQEADVRGTLNEAPGFGLFSPITLSFDKPLDVEGLIERHQQTTPDFSDDAVYLVNVDPDSPGYGEFELLDMGLGNFPLTHARPDGFFPNDRRSDGTNLLFPSAEHHGGEPNLRDPGADPLEFGQLLDFYERKTNTLILRSVEPLKPATRYAVVLTSAVRGEDFRPVDSPFDAINHTHQTDDLEPIREILPEAFPERFDSALANIRFAWSFTTDVPTAPLEEIRAGLYGYGSMAELADEFPAEFHTIHNVTGEDDDQMTFSLDAILPIVLQLAADEVGSGGAGLLEDSYDYVSHLVSGSFLSPNLLGPEDGIGIAEPDEIITIETPRGTVDITATEVPFLCVVPRAEYGTDPPFPVIIYSHAISSTRLEVLGFAGAMAKFGFASCTIDAAGHGVDIPSEFEDLLSTVASNQNLENLPFVLDFHRARDLTNNGTVDSGGDYFTSDMIHSRAMIGQTTIDQMQLVRILRSFDGTKRFVGDERPLEATRDVDADWDQSGDGEAELAGDFTGDGKIDFGGDRPYVTWGTSLGGIQSSILAAVEPTVAAGASNAGGGGLGDIAVRTTIGNVRASVILRMMGPVLIGNPSADGQSTVLQWLLPVTTGARTVPLAEVPALEDGDRVVIRNLAREQHDAIGSERARSEDVVEDGIFRLGTAAEAMGPAQRRTELGFDATLDLYEDVMGCTEARECADVSCDDDHYCSPDGQCRPLAGCWGEFDPDAISEEMREQYDRRVIDDPTEFGDPLVVEIYGSDDELKEEIDTFEYELIDQNILYPEGAPLAALSDGWGLTRQTPEFRQFVGTAQTLLEHVDPAAWAPHLSLRPLEYEYETADFQHGATNFLTIGTLGDQVVPISASIAIARAAGAIETLEPDFYYGMPQNQYLIENYVYEGIPELDRFRLYPQNLFDPDGLDQGRWPAPKPTAAPPVRATRHTDTGVNALRLGYLDAGGEHTFNVPDPSREFDGHAFLTNQVGWFLATGGQVISDDICLEDYMMESCGFFASPEFTNPL